jgi:hypothetical protein
MFGSIRTASCAAMRQVEAIARDSLKELSVQRKDRDVHGEERA